MGGRQATVRRVLSRQLRLALEMSPGGLTAFRTWRGEEFSPVTEASDLVVSGFQSSANTYVVNAVRQANPGLRIASHAHSWTELALAARLNRPAIFLAREPVPALSSALARFGASMTPRWAAADYARLYTRALALRSHFVLADFATATEAVGSILAQVNRMFGTDLVVFADDDERTRRQVLEDMQAKELARQGSDDDIRRSLPTAGRDRRKLEIERSLLDADMRRLVESCRIAYERLMATGLG